jgi:hypothetical protein
MSVAPCQVIALLGAKRRDQTLDSPGGLKGPTNTSSDSIYFKPAAHELGETGFSRREPRG